jgi:putative SOS response-associated peptidase YedK
MPVILTGEEFATWLTALVEEALALQRPLPDGRLETVLRGERKDERAA